MQSWAVHSCKPWGDAIQTSHFVSALVLTATLACPHAARAQLSRVYPGGMHQYVVNSEMQGTAMAPSVVEFQIRDTVVAGEGAVSIGPEPRGGGPRRGRPNNPRRRQTIQRPPPDRTWAPRATCRASHTSTTPIEFLSRVPSPE
jgi:hypothetical protein